jgi:ATP synthase protein I
MREDQRKWARKAGLASSIGLVLVVSTAIGFAFGWWLDGKLGTDPWFTLLLTILGMVAGFVEVFRIVKRISEDDGLE